MGAPEHGNGDRLDEAVLLSVLAEVKGGDFTVRMPLDWTGVAGKVADGFNEVILGEPGARRRARSGQPGGGQGGQALAAGRRSDGSTSVWAGASSRSTA